MTIDTIILFCRCARSEYQRNATKTIDNILLRLIQIRKYFSVVDYNLYNNNKIRRRFMNIFMKSTNGWVNRFRTNIFFFTFEYLNDINRTPNATVGKYTTRNYE